MTATVDNNDLTPEQRARIDRILGAPAPRPERQRLTPEDIREALQELASEIAAANGATGIPTLDELEAAFLAIQGEATRLYAETQGEEA